VAPGHEMTGTWDISRLDHELTSGADCLEAMMFNNNGFAG
jgi:hypothetical protein